MSAPTPSKLDANQVLQASFDEAEGRLRVDTEATVVVGAIEVAIDATTDSIKVLGANGNSIEPNADGSLNVEINAPADYGVSTDAIRTASQIGNATGAADFGIGPITAQTLRTASNVLSIDPNGITAENKESGIVLSNCTTTPLLAGQIYTGAWVDASQYSCISWTINADVNSATNGLRLQFSHDGINVIRQSATNFTGGPNGVFFSFPVHANYFRMYYENGAVAQTRFWLDVQLHEEYNGLAALPLDTPLNDKSSATAVKAIISGKAVDGVYVNQRAGGVSTMNSTATSLAANATYLGTFEDVLGYGNISFTVHTDTDSATDGLVLEYSTDGVNVDEYDSYTVSANEGKQITVGVIARYFRVRYTNGPTPQSILRISSMYHTAHIKPSSHRIEDNITGQNDGELVKAVATGKNPNGLYTNIVVQGDDDDNSTTTPLNANEVYRGTWHRWADDYLTLISSVNSDVAGTMYIDATDVLAPVNGSDVSIDYSAASAYDPSEVTTLRRNTPLQSVWIRHRYVNGPAAQSSFHLHAIFTTQDPGAVYLPAREIPVTESLAAIGRNITTIPNAAGDGFQDTPVDPLTGDPKVTVQTIRDDIMLKPMSSTQVEQGVISITPARIDSSPLLNRRKVIISNDGLSNCSIGFSSGITYNSGSFVLKAGKERELDLDSSVPLWAVAENTGGVSTVYTRAGTTAAGTATSTSNALTSNDLYSNITAAAQTTTVTGYTAGTANPLVSVKLGVEGSKQSGQFETVAFVDAVTGSAGNTGTVTSASVTAVATHTYLVSVAWSASAASITTVVGMGATWTLVASDQTATLDTAIATYVNTTPALGNDTITVNFSATTGGSTMVVSRYSGVNTSSPIQSFETINSSAGVASYSDSLLGVAKGMLVTSVGIKGQTHTAGSGATERAEIHQAANAGIAVNTFPIVTTGAQAYSGTFGGNVKYGIVALTLNPADAINPRISLSYELSAVPGATSGLVTFSSTVDSNSTVDVTGDRAWVVGDIPNVKVIATGSIISAAAANIDFLYLEVTDTTGNSTRLSVLQLGRSF